MGERSTHTHGFGGESKRNDTFRKINREQDDDIKVDFKNHHFGVSGLDSLALSSTSCYTHGTETSNFYLLGIS